MQHETAEYKSQGVTSRERAPFPVTGNKKTQILERGPLFRDEILERLKYGLHWAIPGSLVREDTAP
ncbi:hypothetical protein O9K51_10060 [Purpureocillium lavendulum]|uniref:Uncharacterized protein n=1 Tax=Purpureocillium lavendulum TaxID=1247861 RepID=A0AB34FGG3_9HYPO|nr:hypothetical protein O9K51_10060 [Purpureocillium lavendulum]